MGKKSKKRMAEAEAMMAEALRIKEEALKLASANAVNANPQSTDNNNPIPASLDQPSAYKFQEETASPKRNNSMIAIIGVGLLVAAICMYLLYDHYIGAGKKGAKAKAEKAGVVKAGAGTDATNGPSVVEAWEMPEELKEISSIAFIDDERVACVQDQKGIIYIYNLKAKAVEKRVDFAKKGDFEGIVVVGSTFYVLRADGVMFEVPADGKAPKEYHLPLTIENDTEPMFYEAAKNRILVGVKEKDPSGADGKGVYAFDLATKNMSLTPVVVLTVTDDKSEEAEAPADEKKSGKGKKGKSSFNPSEIAVHPKTGKIYALNGPESEFMVFDAEGKMLNKYALDKQIFPQPEGMTFSPSGDLYLSSEASKKTGAVIAKVAFQE